MSMEQDLYNREYQILNEREGAHWDREIFKQDQNVTRNRQLRIMQRDYLLQMEDGGRKKGLKRTRLNKSVNVCHEDKEFKNNTKKAMRRLSHLMQAGSDARKISDEQDLGSSVESSHDDLIKLVLQRSTADEPEITPESLSSSAMGTIYSIQSFNTGGQLGDSHYEGAGSTVTNFSDILSAAKRAHKSKLRQPGMYNCINCNARLIPGTTQTSQCCENCCSRFEHVCQRQQQQQQGTRYPSEIFGPSHMIDESIVQFQKRNTPTSSQTMSPRYNESLVRDRSSNNKSPYSMFVTDGGDGLMTKKNDGNENTNSKQPVNLIFRKNDYRIPSDVNSYDLDFIYNQSDNDTKPESSALSEIDKI